MISLLGGHLVAKIFDQIVFDFETFDITSCLSRYQCWGHNVKTSAWGESNTSSPETLRKQMSARRNFVVNGRARTHLSAKPREPN
ncbi:hypothetical protein DTO212C5_7342 [Paecilomyces variotii]|nr:hypothetical protein DTO212C5_7342 [Paecilomyces variotii]